MRFIGTAELVILSYFCLVCLGYALSLLVAAAKLSRIVVGDDSTRFNDLLRQNHHKPISILVPAYNEEETIVSSVSSFLNLHYPTFEVIVIDDGSTDGTLQRLKEGSTSLRRILNRCDWCRTRNSSPVTGAKAIPVSSSCRNATRARRTRSTPA